MATMSIRSRKTNQRVDSCAQMQTHEGDDDGDGDGDEDGGGAIICQERFWFQKGRTWDVRTEGRKRAEK